MRTFLYIDGIGHESSRPGSRTAAGLLIASRGLLEPAEGISVPFVARVRGSTRPLRVVIGRVSVPVEAGLHQSRVLGVLGSVCLARPVQAVDVALPVRVRLGETLNGLDALTHVLLRSCRCAGSRLMTAFSCWWRVACSAARCPDCPRRSVFTAHAYCSRRSSMLNRSIRRPSSLRGSSGPRTRAGYSPSRHAGSCQPS